MKNYIVTFEANMFCICVVCFFLLLVYLFILVISAVMFRYFFLMTAYDVCNSYAFLCTVPSVLWHCWLG